MAVTTKAPAIEYQAIDTFEPADENPKKHDLPAIKASLQRFGFVAPVVLDERTGQLVAGHGRVTALRQLQLEGVDPPARVRVSADGGWECPVLRGVAFASKREAQGYLLADNRLTMLGGWDDGQLAEMLVNFEELDGVGWSSADVEAMVNVPEFERSDDTSQLDETDSSYRLVSCPACQHEFKP